MTDNTGHTRRTVLAALASAGMLGASTTAAADEVNVGGGSMSDKLSHRVAQVYSGPADDLDEPGVRRRYYHVTEGNALWNEGDILEDTGDSWRKIDLGIGSLSTEEVVPMKLGILPDVHWGQQSIENDAKPALDIFIDKMNDWGADYVIQMGDLVYQDTLSETATEVSNARDYIENTGGTNGNGISCPIEYTLGNHEYKHTENGDMADIYEAFGWGSTLESTFTTHEVKGWKIIQINSAYTDTNTNNGTADARIPDDSDPFDAISWLEDELDTDKPVITHTHYGLNNSWGDDYRTTRNAYKALQKLAESNSLVTNLHGHAHANNDWDCGKKSVGPFGMPFWNGGHICKGLDVWYTYSDPPQSVFGMGQFWHPEKFRIDTTLNTPDRRNITTDATFGNDQHPSSVLRGDGNHRMVDLGSNVPWYQGSSGSGAWNQRERFNRLELSTGTTDGSHAAAGWQRNNVNTDWNMLEGWTVNLELTTIGASESYRTRCARGEPPGEGGADEWYGFKLEDGNLRGVVGTGGVETTTDTVLTSLSEGDDIQLSAMLFAPHICIFYWNDGSGWEKDEITTEGALPQGSSSMRRMFRAILENKAAEDYQVDYYEFEYWRQGH